MESTWDIYHMRNALLYVGEGSECTNPDPPWFFLHTYAVHAKDLFPPRRRYGFEEWHFSRDWGWRRHGKCYVLARLRTYEIAEIATGQYVNDPVRTLWEARYSPLRAEGKNRS